MRSQTRVFLIAASVLAIQLGALSTSRADLIGYWPFDEVSEVDGQMITPDNSPDGGHNGVLGGEALLAEDPDRGNVMDFGAFNNNAVVELPTFPQDERADAGFNPDLGPGFNAISGSTDETIEGTQNATISMWFNRQGEPPTDQWTFLFQDGGNRQLGSHAPWSNNNVYFDVSGCCAVDQRINADWGEVNDGWHHLAYVKRKDDGWDNAVTAIYVDGSVVVSSPGWPDNAAGDATISDVVPITSSAIGAAPGGGNSQNGLIDDFAIWNEALDEERIQGLAAGGGVIPIPPGEVVGDFNSDDVINSADFAIQAENFNAKFSVEEAFFKGDMDGNLRINMKDFVLFRTLFEMQPAGVASAVPEPSTLALLTIACGALLGFCRRRR